VHRLNMGVFPQGAQIIPNPYNKIPGFSVVDAASGGGVFFVPGFPVMAWPMIEWVLDTHCRAQHRVVSLRERSVIVMGSMEATLTPLMEAVEREFAGIRVYSLPSVGEGGTRRHIELGAKGEAAQVGPAYERLRAGVLALGGTLG